MHTKEHKELTEKKEYKTDPSPRVVEEKSNQKLFKKIKDKLKKNKKDK